MTDDTTGTETAGEAWKCPECEGRTVQCTGCGFVEDAIYAPAAPTEARGLGERVAALAEIIWHTSRADEGTISATGANIVARALLDAGYTPGDSLACCPECGSVFETEDNTVVCDHAPEVSAKRLAEAAAPETEGPAQTLLTAGAVPFADETGHGFEIDLTSAQPAAEGAREDDGLDREELEHTIFGAMEALGIEDAAMSDARMIADAVEGLLSDWSGSSRP